MSKYSVMGYEPALVLVATLMAIMAVSVVAVPAAHHLHHHSGGHHRMTSSNGAAGSSSPSLSGIDHPLSKRSFFDIQCKGVYDKTIFARLDRVCEDCYNLFREPQLHSLCRFASPSLSPPPSRPVRPVIIRNPPPTHPITVYMIIASPSPLRAAARHPLVFSPLYEACFR